MVTVKFFNLLRSKYDIHEFEVLPGTINDILLQIKKMYPQVDLKDFELSVIFVNGNRVIHHAMYHKHVEDGDDVVFTHFVGGG